jgi:glycosyltransferase involved in cell wall biosynthesis
MRGNIKDKKVLIITRKYPPSVGGMEAYSRSFIRHMEPLYHVDKIVLGGKQANLVWFLPYALVSSVFLNLVKKYDLVYLCDGLLAPLGVVLKSMFGVKTAVTIHGLDITYDRFFYQNIVPPAVAKLDKVVCVSGNTREECLKRGIGEGKCVVISNGLEEDMRGRKGLREGISSNATKIGPYGGKKILISVGRLIRRKGIDWFIENVMTKLDKEYIYLVVGEGPERGRILEAVEDHGLEDRVRLLGRLDEISLMDLYDSAHAMVMPNQRIHNDPEGFGIVAIEAAGRGLPVIASSVDGIKEAVIEGKTGWLIRGNQADLFVEKIRDIGLRRDVVKQASAVFSWDRIIRKYEEVLNNV